MDHAGGAAFHLANPGFELSFTSDALTNKDLGFNEIGVTAFGSGFRGAGAAK